MQLEVITNPDNSKKLLYKLARIVYAETSAKSLRVVEALVSMIQNYMNTYSCDLESMVSNSELFDSLNPKSSHYQALSVDANCRSFEMCLRIVTRMIHGNLPDMCFGATRFHREGMMPDWATARGYIADIDGLLFYL